SYSLHPSSFLLLLFLSHVLTLRVSIARVCRAYPGARGAFVFTLIRDPADRIRAVFSDVTSGALATEGLEGLGDLLRERYGATGEPGADFDAFLDFVEDNIEGRTAAPYHPAWAPQSDLLAAYAAETPVDFIARAKTVEDDVGVIFARLGLVGDGLATALRDALSAPLTPELTSPRRERIERIYARDYARLGFRTG
ncbi:MAG: sulfotransferase family 2 domain-containing protein, partial [Pseudomonadota bacterium]